jgi:hypothetical protein
MRSQTNSPPESHPVVNAANLPLELWALLCGSRAGGRMEFNVNSTWNLNYCTPALAHNYPLKEKVTKKVTKKTYLVTAVR